MEKMILKNIKRNVKSSVERVLLVVMTMVYVNDYRKKDKDANGLCEQHNNYELKWDGERDNEENKNKCEEQRRESFDFRNAEGVRQRLEKEDKAANDLCKKSSEKNKATPNDIGIDPPTSTVLLLKKPTVTSLF